MFTSVGGNKGLEKNPGNKRCYREITAKIPDKNIADS
jgi:hypothetical protein